MKIELSNTDINQIMKALLISKSEDHNFYEIFWKFRRKFEDNGIKFEPSKWNGDIKVKVDDKITYIIYNRSDNSYLEDFQYATICGKQVSDYYSYRYIFTDNISKALEFTDYHQGYLFIEPIARRCTININDLEILKIAKRRKE